MPVSIAEHPSIAEHLAEFVRARFRVAADDPAFDEDAHLFEEGYVDSTGFVDLVSHVEERYGITLPDHALFSEEFTTLRGIAAVIEQLGGVEPARGSEEAPATPDEAPAAREEPGAVAEHVAALVESARQARDQVRSGARWIRDTVAGVSAPRARPRGARDRRS